MRFTLARFLAFGVCPLLFVLSVIGVWHAIDWGASQTDVDRLELVGILFKAIVPIALFALCFGYAMARFARLRADNTYQEILSGLQQRLHYQEDLVRLIADKRPGATSIIDDDGRFWFVNEAAAAQYGFESAEIIGRHIDKVLTAQESLHLRARLQEVREKKQPINVIQRQKENHQTRFMRTLLSPLPAIMGLQDAVMVHSDDITDMIVEREARERTFRQVIDTLVAVVDRRDPFATGHSARVGQIARAISEEMDLSVEEVETAEIAGLLMNFGKVLVPRSILTKTTALTPEELRQIRDSILTSADILSLIGFSQPVVPTLRQVLERVDGAGVPEGRAGDNILMTARVVTVANAFVALVSPRAHRAGLGVNAAVEALLNQADKIYDRRVVLALTHFVQNRQNKPDWLASS